MTDSPGKQRLDAAVVARGLAETRARAQAIIQGGGISVDGHVITRPAASVGEATQIELVNQPLPYVSRGGLKLERAVERFDVQPGAKIAVDVGASTGGFTDVLLQNGAVRVYAIDVGYGQLAWRLRNDPRVVVLERTNIRNVDALPEQAELAVIDVSFISLRQVLPHVRSLLVPGSDIIALVKPQFEAGRERVGRKGVVRSPHVWMDVLSDVLGWVAEQGWSVLGLERSPIHGPAGNVEFLVHIRVPPAPTSIDIPESIQRVVEEPA